MDSLTSTDSPTATSRQIRAATRGLTITNWVDAFNRRDLEAMLETLHPKVVFAPLRVEGIATKYKGHNGVREWFHSLHEHRHVHRIDFSGITHSPDGHFLATGTVTATEGYAIPFCGLYEFRGELIVTASHYYSRLGTMRPIIGLT